MFSKNIFSARIIELRKANNITQSALAAAVGLNRTAITLIEKAERACSVEVLYQLAQYFNVSADYLLGLSDNPNRV